MCFCENVAESDSKYATKIGIEVKTVTDGKWVNY